MHDNVKTIKKSRIILGIVTLAVIFVIFLYFSGYRLVDGFRIGKVGSVTLSLPFADTSVFIDESKKIITKKENEELNISLSPKDHSIIISRESYYPWKKDFKILSSASVILSPIFVSQNPSGSIINKNDPEYYKILSEIQKAEIPTEKSVKNSKDGTVSMWLKDKTVMSKIGDKESEVIKPITEIRNLDFYKDRNDAVIFSTANAVFVVEIDKAGNQNFMPIYKGTKPSFWSDSINYIYILDAGTLMQVII